MFGKKSQNEYAEEEFENVKGEFLNKFVSYYWYIDCACVIKQVYEYILRESAVDNTVQAPNVKYNRDFNSDIVAQLWCLLVLLYGNYGVSPFTGWLENAEGAASFLMAVYHRISDENE